MIEVAIQSGSSVKVYGDGNRLLFTISGNLTGYTSSTVSVKRGSSIATYDDRGKFIGSR